MKKTGNITDGKASARKPGEKETVAAAGVMPVPNGLGIGEAIVIKEPVVAESLIPQEALKEESSIQNVNVAILSEEGFEEIELTSPRNALQNAGAHVDVISPHRGKIKAWNKNRWGKEINVDVRLSDARVENYDAVILPGGVMNPDKLRQNKDAVAFLKKFIRTGKPVAAICHGAQTLIETGMINGKTMTSYPSLQTDLRNAGVNWVDTECVHFGQFITSRKPADLGAFNRELIYVLSLQEH